MPPKTKTKPLTVDEQNLELATQLTTAMAENERLRQTLVVAYKAIVRWGQSASSFIEISQLQADLDLIKDALHE
jgi:hypothetical protein